MIAILIKCYSYPERRIILAKCDVRGDKVEGTWDIGISNRNKAKWTINNRTTEYLYEVRSIWNWWVELIDIDDVQFR